MKKKDKEMKTIKNTKELRRLWISLLILPLYAYSKNTTQLFGHWTIRVESFANYDSIITEENYSEYFNKWAIYPNGNTEVYLYNDMKGIVCIPSQSPFTINWSVINDTILITTEQRTKEYTIIAYHKTNKEIIIAENNVSKGDNRHLYIIRGRKHNFDDFVYDQNIHYFSENGSINTYLSAEVIEENLNAICIGMQDDNGIIHYNYISAPIEERLTNKGMINILFLLQDNQTNDINNVILVKTIYNEFLPCKREIYNYKSLCIESK